MADNSDEIRELEELIQAAVSKSTIDGVSLDFDLDAARRRLRELRATDDSARNRGRRPYLAAINLTPPG